MYQKKNNIENSMIEPKIFKAYDIRGIYPDQLNEKTALLVGKAFVQVTGAKKIAIGRDMRGSSPALVESLVTGMISQGADVLDIGEVSTPMMSYAVASDDSIEAGIMVTASHNPAEYNGMKMMRGDMSPVCKGAGMEELLALVQEGNFEDAVSQGSVEYTDVLEGYTQKVLSLVDTDKIKGMKVVIDAGNGVNGPISREVLRNVEQLDISELYFEPDGTFPHHEANPLDHETLADLRTRVATQNADFGVAFDGDGDRLGVMDEVGNIIPGDLLTALLSQFLLQKKQGGLVYYDLRSSWIVKDIVEQNGGEARPCEVGRSNIINYVRTENAVLAGELSCHFYYQDFYGVESADLTLLLLAQIISESGKSLSELVDPLRKYFQSGEINSSVKDKDIILKTLEEKYGQEAQEVSHMDGLKITYEDYWFNVRPSNTEPLLRLNVEATTQEKMEQIRDQLLGIIRS